MCLCVCVCVVKTTYDKHLRITRSRFITNVGKFSIPVSLPNMEEDTPEYILQHTSVHMIAVRHPYRVTAIYLDTNTFTPVGSPKRISVNMKAVRYLSCITAI